MPAICYLVNVSVGIWACCFSNLPKKKPLNNHVIHCFMNNFPLAKIHFTREKELRLHLNFLAAVRKINFSAAIRLQFGDYHIYADAEYLKNGTRQRHSYNGILIGTYTCAIQGYHFKWPWVTLKDLPKYLMTWSIARPLCDSWASCRIDARVVH